MTRTASFDTSITTNSKSSWLSKFACRKGETLPAVDQNNVEEKNHSSNDSTEITCPSFDNENIVSAKKNYSYGKRNTIRISSFPICSVGCSKQSEETAINSCILRADHENVSDFDNDEEYTANDTPFDCNFKELTHIFENNQKKMINREVLSPTLQLLHEVYLKKLPSNSEVYFLTNCQFPFKDGMHLDTETTQSMEEKGTVHDSISRKLDQNKEDDASLQKTRIFRQQLRYEAIRKELFDNVSVSTIEKRPAAEHAENILRHEEYNESRSAVETVGCQPISLWNFIPNMSNLFLHDLPDNEVIDDSEDERDSDELSCTVGTNDELSLFSYETESNSGDVEDDYNFRAPNENVHGTDKQKSSVEIENHEDPSYSSTFMDQSHIYLMMTSARQGSAASRKIHDEDVELSPTMGNTINGKKVSELAIDDLTINSRITLDVVDDAMSRNGENYDFKDVVLPDFGWVRHFQPFGNNQVDVNIRQKQWLNVIHVSFKDQNGLDSGSDKQIERQLAASEALRRILQQRTSHNSFNPLSSMTFDLWA